MESILDSTSSKPALEAVCRVLLPDFAYFHYSLPKKCAEITGMSHGVTCLHVFPPLRTQLLPLTQSTRTSKWLLELITWAC